MKEIRSATEGIEELYSSQGSRLWRALFAYARDPDLASDAVAETFLQALRQWEQISDPSTWIWKVGFRTASRELKRRRLMSSEAVSSYVMDERALQLTLALGRLRPRPRAVVLLHYYGGYQAAEIAEMLGLRPTSVSVILHRARARLRELLGEDDE